MHEITNLGSCGFKSCVGHQLMEHHQGKFDNQALYNKEFFAKLRGERKLVYKEFHNVATEHSCSIETQVSETSSEPEETLLVVQDNS